MNQETDKGTRDGKMERRQSEIEIETEMRLGGRENPVFFFVGLGFKKVRSHQGCEELSVETQP